MLGRFLKSIVGVIPYIWEYQAVQNALDKVTLRVVPTTLSHRSSQRHCEASSRLSWDRGRLLLSQLTISLSNRRGNASLSNPSRERPGHATKCKRSASFLEACIYLGLLWFWRSRNRSGRCCRPCVSHIEFFLSCWGLDAWSPASGSRKRHVSIRRLVNVHALGIQ